MYERGPASYLIGRVVNKLFVNDRSDIIKFILEDGQEVLFETYADCCSETWIQEIINTEALFGHVIISAKDMNDVELPEYPDSGRQEQDQSYGVRFETAGGISKLIYRNSSNGYYGGSLNMVGRVSKNEVFKEVTEDYNA